MYILATIPHETIWGGTKLAKLVGKKNINIGHLYSVYCREGTSNVVLNGAHAGTDFNEIFDMIKSKYHLEEYLYFPITIALVDASENLSIQVHPDENKAEKLEGIRIGKQESWYFFTTPDNGYIFNGCKCHSKEDVLKNIEQNNMEKIFGHLIVNKGDYVSISPGTLHAMTSGSFVYEIEVGSDYTYRFFDYHRKDSEGKERELHLEKAIYALDTQLKSNACKFESGVEICEKSYASKYIENVNEYKNIGYGLECITIIKGRFELENLMVTPGMTIILEPGEVLKDASRIDIIIARLIKE